MEIKGKLVELEPSGLTNDELVEEFAEIRNDYANIVEHARKVRDNLEKYSLQYTLRKNGRITEEDGEIVAPRDFLSELEKQTSNLFIMALAVSKKLGI